MNLLKDDDLTIKICKFGGPLVLFICTPLMAYIFWKVAQKDVAVGIPLQPRNLIEVISIVLSGILFGGWMCKKGYGWFGGTKPPKPEL